MPPHTHEDRFLPAAGVKWLMPIYDTMTRLAGIRTDHARLIELAGLAAGQRVLEIGCGTGNLTLLAARLRPGVELVGVDPDRTALTQAERKANRKANRKARRARSVRFEHGYGQRLPYPDASFDRVLSAFMLHHLEGESRGQTLAEVRRVLRPGGALYLVDFGGRAAGREGFLARRLRHSSRLRSNLGDGIPVEMRAAGFSECTELAQRVGRLGPVTYYRASL